MSIREEARQTADGLSALAVTFPWHSRERLTIADAACAWRRVAEQTSERRAERFVQQALAASAAITAIVA